MKRTFLTLYLFFLFLCVPSSLAQRKLIISAIPDQYPEKLNRLYGLLASELSKSLNVPVVYKPVTNYQAAVSAFRTNSIDLVWFGGLTGVQARLQRPGSMVLAQREIDANFHSLFIANKNTKIKKINSIDQLKVLKGKRFTFGSESSTSGRLMPQYFLEQANVKIKDFKGNRAGFSGSHDATLALVQSGAYEAGVLNEQVWKYQLENNKINLKKVGVIWRTPPYKDYHWLAQPNLDKTFRKGFTSELQRFLLSLNKKNHNQKIILELFGADKFIKSDNNQYKSIEDIGRKLGKIR